MKKLVIALFAVAAGVLSAKAANTMYPYELPEGKQGAGLGCEKADQIIKAGGKLELGKWYTDFTTCKKYCDDNGLPLLAVWSNHECIHCWYTDLCFIQPEFIEWKQTHNAGQVIYCFMAGGEKGCPDQEGSNAYKWMWSEGGEQLKAYPFVVLWWKAKGINYRTTGDAFCSDEKGKKPINFWTNASLPARIQNMTYWMEKYFGAWAPVLPYAGGYFSQTNYPYASLQAEKNTTFVDVEIVRNSAVKTNQTMKIAAPGKTAKTVTINWATGQFCQTNRIDNFNTAWFVEGKDVTLTLMDGSEVKSTVKIACKTPENSTGNPDFKGCSDFGVWTMDLDAAKAKAKGTSGQNYTLVCIQGSLWCPDCGRVEKNFLGAEDGSGKNRFAEWAKSKRVALVTIDIPNFGSASVEAESPCLLKTEPYPTNPEGAAEKELHSGLGYLTRKMVTADEARKTLERNHTLVSTMTYEGGFNRPEERDYKGRTYRTGAPVFVLLNKDGAVRAHLVRLAEDSPTDSNNFDNYIKRFEEMLDIADNNSTEIENNYASPTGSVAFKANGGSERARLCNADMYDTFRLDGVGGNAMQQVVVTGDAGLGFDGDAEVTVEFQKLENGQAVTLGTPVTGKLGQAITNEYTFTEGGDYYVQVRGWGPTVADRAKGYNSNAFKLSSNVNKHFQNYVIRGATVLMPQEDKATAKAAEGSDKVTIRLETEKDGQPVVYLMKGIKSCDQLKPIPGAPAGFFAAIEAGIAEITLERIDGELSYQVWNPGEVGFTETKRTVTESVCDVMGGKPLELTVKRLDGKSGHVKLSVSVNEELTTLWPDEEDIREGKNIRFELQTTELEWNDGDTADKTVKLLVHDIENIFYGNGDVVLDLAIVDGDYGMEIAAGKSRYTLTVVEDDKQSPGRAMISRLGEICARAKTVYARQSDKTTVYVARIEASDGIVSMIPYSSVAGTQFSTDNPFDLQINENDKKLHFYWASHEFNEKPLYVTGVPAGKTATIKLLPYGNFKVLSASNSVTIVSVADDAPGFEVTKKDFAFVRYVTPSDSAVALTGLQGGQVSFSKLSGSLPAGLKVAYDEEKQAMVLSGVVTAKAGTYTSVYQVREKRDKKTVAGLTVQLNIEVTDLAEKQESGEEPLNPALAKSRTLKDLPVIDGTKRRLAGLLTLTIPASGKVSGKFTGLDGTVSYSTKNWSDCSADYTVSAELAASRREETLHVEVQPDGAVWAIFRGGDFEGLNVETDGKTWSKTDSATDWKGYYTVVMKNNTRDTTGYVPTGDGYLTLKMSTTSACNSGKFTVAGMLPNGTKFSGSSTLVRMTDEGGATVAYVPFLKTSSKDLLSACAMIAANAVDDQNRRCVESPADVNGYWKHIEKKPAEATYEVDLTLHGSYYDAKEDLGGCCVEFFQSNMLNFYVGGAYVGGGAFAPQINVGKDTIKLIGDNPSKLKLTFTRSTGVVSGSFVNADKKSISYSGVVVNGWGNDCGCGNYDVYLPFVSGSCYWSEGSPRLTYGESVKIDK